MKVEKEPWALILAGGEGRRLSRLTTDRNGRVWPKQYWSLDGHKSFLNITFERAARIVSRQRIATVVAARHRPFWDGKLPAFPAANVVVQPENRGTAAGILLPLLTILSREADPAIVVLPSDHYVSNERALAATIRYCLSRLGRDDLVLLGMTPEEADPDLGWIMPTHESHSFARVAYFVEKPSVEVASKLHESGGLWNSFIFVVSGRKLLSLFESRLPSLVTTLRRALEADGGMPGEAVAKAYAELDDTDFSRQILQGSEHSLAVARVPACGWSDLGTPARVRRIRQRMNGVTTTYSGLWYRMARLANAPVLAT